MDHTQATNSYYNSIAETYDSLMEQTPANRIARKAMRDYFTASVTGGTVLDFGGGTGADMEWMSKAGYTIYFCEPSEGMRTQAIQWNKEKLNNERILFLSNAKTDFTKWKMEKPFADEVDAVLANFAVINCIGNIDLLFENLAAVMKPGAHLIALVLERSTKTLIRHYLKSTLRSVIFRKPLSIGVHHKEEGFSAYLYSTAGIRKASEDHFEFIQNKALKETPFALLHLVKR